MHCGLEESSGVVSAANNHCPNASNSEDLHTASPTADWFNESYPGRCKPGTLTYKRGPTDFDFAMLSLDSLL